MGKPILHIRPYGRLGNRMIQYMAALKIASTMPDYKLSNVQLPEWGIEIPATPESSAPERVLRIRGQFIDIVSLVRDVEEQRVDRISLEGPCQRMANFLSAEEYRQTFRIPQIVDVGFGEEFLVCNIRTGDIANGFHPHYTLIPIDFYEETIEHTGLQPVFLGEIEDNPYCRELRRRFPRAVFRPSRGPLHDFVAIRSSSNIVLAVSTFSWLAAWLSHARNIYMPVTGLLNPMQFPTVDLLPLDDDRYHFFLFPINFSTTVDKVLEMHKSLSGLWRQMTPLSLDSFRKRRPRFPRRIDQYLPHFDEQIYRSASSRMTKELGDLGPDALRAHYIHTGFGANIPCFKFDSKWYAEKYPMAAFEVGQGDYLDLPHQYVHVGAIRGYKANPSE